MDKMNELINWLMVFSNDNNQTQVKEYKMERMTKIPKPEPKIKTIKPIIDKDEYKKNIEIIKKALESPRIELNKPKKIELKKNNGKVTCPCTNHQKEYSRIYWYEHIKSQKHSNYEIKNNVKLIMV